MASRKIIAASAFAAALATGGVVGATLGNPLTSGADPSAAVAPSGPSGASGPDAGHGPDGHRGPGRFMDLSVAAKTLNLSEADLRSALESGKSLADIAKDQGVDKQTLIDALVAEATKQLDQMKADLPNRIADLVDGKMPAGGRMGGPDGDHRGRGPGGHLDEAAKVLGLSEAELHTALESGKSLADIAKDQGVDKQKVIDALVAAEKAEIAQAVKDGRLTQDRADKITAELSTRITDMVDGKMPPRGRGMGPGGMGPGGMDRDGDGPGGN